MILPQQCYAECVERRIERLEPARVERSQRRLANDDVERGALPRTGLCENERPSREVERREPQSRRDLRPWLAPLEATGDHEVEDEEEIALERERDALADPPHAAHRAALCARERRLDGAHEVGAHDAGTHQRRADEPRREVLDVERDVRQLGHGGTIAHGGARSVASTRRLGRRNPLH